MKKNYYRKRPIRKRGKSYGSRGSKSSIRIKPGSDAKLKKVFDCIGVPERKPFIPDDFQLEAVKLMKRFDCLVTAPTGSGKTWIAEQAVETAIKKGNKVWYGTPLKALTNTIYAAFVDKFGQTNIGILTGDIKENPDAPVIIGTTEILRNQLYDAMHSGIDLNTDVVILDEAHFLGDPERGVVWEEIMIYLPQRIPLLMLSATIGNASEIADWLTQIRNKKCVIVEETARPVPLHPLFFHPSGTLFPLISKINKTGKTTLYKKVANYAENPNAPLLAPPNKLPPIADIMRVLKRYRLLPAIFFMKSRADCDGAVELCTEELLLKDPDRKERLSQRIQELIEDKAHISKHRQKWILEHLAVGSHHSGQLPAWKIVIETLMSEGLLDAIFATSTVAAGVNFPARTVVILNSDRFNGTEFLPLTPTEFSQMTGRAGRRGKDNIGFAVALPGKFMNLKLMSKLVCAPPGEVISQIRINFSMVLNLLLSHTPKQIKLLLSKSFASYRYNMRASKNKGNRFFDHETESDALWRDFQLHLAFLKQEGFVNENDLLTEDGFWASRLRIDSPLLVAEGFRLNLFPDNDPALLAALISSFVNERESDDTLINKSKLPKKLITSFVRVKRLLQPFAKNMMISGFDVTPLYLKPSVTIYAWALGQPWDDVLRGSGLAEGDLARLILRTADNLNHISNLKEHFPDIAKTADKSIDLILRDPVVTEYLL